MKSVNDLSQRGIIITPELKQRVIDEVIKRMDGVQDGILHEGLDQIIANQYTVLKLRKDLQNNL